MFVYDNNRLFHGVAECDKIAPISYHILEKKKKKNKLKKKKKTHTHTIVVDFNEMTTCNYIFLRPTSLFLL